MSNVFTDLLLRVKTEVDENGKKALKDINKEATAAGDAMGKAANETNKFGKAGRKSGYMIQNASYQIADFFVMLQGGISPVRALSTQLPQLLAGFGAFGAAAGAVAAIGASVFIAFQKGATSAEAYAKSLSELNSVLNLLGEKPGSQVDALARAIEDADEETAALAKALFALGEIKAEQGLKKQTEAFEDYIDGLSELGTATQALFTQVSAGAPVANLLDIGQLNEIKSKFGLTSDAVAQNIQEIIEAFKNGEDSAISLSTQFTELYRSNEIQGNAGLDEFIEQLEKLLQSRNSLEAFKGVLEEIKVDAEVKGLEELERFKNLADPSREAIRGLRAEITDLTVAMSKPIAEGGLTVEQFEKAYKSLLDTYLEGGKISSQAGLDAAIAELNRALDQGIINAEELEERYNALIDSMLQPVKLPKNERLEALKQEGQAILDRFNPAQAAVRQYRVEIFEAEVALRALGLEGKELENILQRIRNEMLEPIVVPPNPAIERQKKAAQDLLDTLDPAGAAVRDYRLQIVELRAGLKLLGLTTEEVDEKIRQFNDTLLQPIVVTAKKRDWAEELDLPGLQGIQQDIKQSFDEWGDSLGDSIVDALDRGMDSFKEFADFIIKQIARIAVQNLIIEPLVNSLGNLFPKTKGINLGEVEQTNPVGDSARFQAVSAAPMMGYIAAPSLAGKTSNSSAITVNVNNYGNDDVEVEQRKTSRGLEIDVLIKGAVKKGIAQGDFDNVMRSSFGTRRLAY